MESPLRRRPALPFRPKLFLALFSICVTPLLILSLISFRSGLQNTQVLLSKQLDAELADTAWGLQALMQGRERELRDLAGGPIRWYLQVEQIKEVDLSEFFDPDQTPPSRANAVVGQAKLALRAALLERRHFARLAYFDPDKRQAFLVEPSANEFTGLKFRTRDFLPAQVQPDERAWSIADADFMLCSVVSQPASGEVVRCSTPVYTGTETAFRRGVLVADFGVDSLMTELGKAREPAPGDQGQSTRMTVVLGPSGKIVYHTNAAFRQQPVVSAMPSFTTVAASMTSGLTGSSFFVSAEGDQWLESHLSLKPQGLSIAVACNYTAATRSARRSGLRVIALSVVFGFGVAMLLTLLYRRKQQSLKSVTQGLAAVAGGELDQRLLLPSSDDLRPIADSVNQISERLREQLAREAEAHQFQSFIKLSALLTHDLKNAIEALSLTVSNMERHFDNAEFRADAMKSLTGATDKLRALVARLSNPVNTLSGEFKMPRPTDLVPLIQRVLHHTAEPLSGVYEIDVRLPVSLFALADAERIEKVVENLVLNALEAMGETGGKLTIAAGQAEGKAHFSVTDTGVGMSPAFIQQRLFHPFATTKARGVGLGLYTCREVVRAGGGSIEVNSVEGSGTTFRVVLASAQPRDS